MIDSFMKRTLQLALLLLLISALQPVKGQVAIGTGATAPTPNPNAVLLLVGNGMNQGLIIPSVTSLSGFGSAGMVVYNTSTNTVHYHNGTAWNQVGVGGSGTQGIQISGNNVSLTATPNAGFGLSSPTPTVTGQLLVWNGTGWESTPAPTTNGQTLSWNQTTGKWIIGTGATVATLIGDVQGASNNTTINTTAGNNIIAALNNAATTNKILESRITASGTNNQVLTTVGGVAQWANPTGGGITNPMTAPNDLIVGGAAGAASRLAAPGNNQLLSSNVSGAVTWIPQTNFVAGGSQAANLVLASPNGFAGLPVYRQVVDADIAGTIAGSKIIPNFVAQNISTTGTLTTGTAGAFAVNATGNITRINGATTSFPAANGTGVLTNDGTGTLTWGSTSGFSTINSIPKGNGTVLAASSITDDGTTVEITATSPKLNLRSTSAVSTTAASSLEFTNAINGLIGSISDTGSSDHFQISSFQQGLLFNTNFNTRMAIDNAGNVGIGTISPVSRLDVSGDVRLAQITAPSTTNDKLYNVGGSLFWNGTNISSGGSGWGLTGNLGTNPATDFIGTTDAQPLRFATGVGGVERMRIDASGKVGIGTVSPNAPLQFANAAANRKIVLSEVANNDHQFFGFGLAAGEMRYQLGNFSNNHVFYGGVSSTTSAEMMRIGNGYVSIGGRTTPVNSSSFFDVQTDNGSGFGGMYVDVADPDGNAFYGYSNLGNSRALTYMNATSGSWNVQTAGSDRLTVTSTGNVGIGTTTPTYPLDIKTPNGVSDYGLNHSDGTITMSTYVGNGGVTGGSIGTQSNHPFFIYTANGGAKLTVLPNGNVGIGTTAPVNSLDVGGGVAIGASYAGVNTAPANGMAIQGNVTIGTTFSNEKLAVAGGTDNGIFIGGSAFSGATAARLVIQASSGFFIFPGMSPEWTIGSYSATGGNLDILRRSASNVSPAGEYSFTPTAFNSFNDNNNSLGTAARRWTTVFAVNGTINTSDARLKENIQDLNYGLGEIMKLRPVSYNWKTGAKYTKLGLIAQETEKIIPEVVSKPEEKDGYYGLMYSDLIPVLIKATQELNAKVEALERENRDLNTDNSQLQSEVATLKQKQDQETVLLKKQIEAINAKLGMEAKKD
jgi:hypothetical protein